MVLVLFFTFAWNVIFTCKFQALYPFAKLEFAMNCQNGNIVECCLRNIAIMNDDFLNFVYLSPSLLPLAIEVEFHSVFQYIFIIVYGKLWSLAYYTPLVHNPYQSYKKAHF